MGAETEVVSVLEVNYFGAKGNNASEVTKSHSALGFDQLRAPDLVSIDLSDSDLSNKAEEKKSDEDLDYVPCIRSGSFADIGPRRHMEDEHILMDDLSSHFQFPRPSAFYGVFDGHGGPEAAAFIKKNATRLFLDDFKFPETSESLRKAFRRADLALADDPAVNPCSGTTALTALVCGRALTVANAGDCRAVLCRKGEAVDMSRDHKPADPPERRRVEQLGGFVEDGYLNGVLSVSRALGDWDMKARSPSPLVSEPELRHRVLTEEDEFLIMGCDGIWDVMSSQQAVGLVRRGLRRHDDPHQCARDLVLEALRLGTFDNLTVVVVCFAPLPELEPEERLRCCSLSAEALCSLRSLLEGGGDSGR